MPKQWFFVCFLVCAGDIQNIPINPIQYCKQFNSELIISYRLNLKDAFAQMCKSWNFLGWIYNWLKVFLNEFFEYWLVQHIASLCQYIHTLPIHPFKEFATLLFHQWKISHFNYSGAISRKIIMSKIASTYIPHCPN